jgi:hypothetical protein
LKYSDPGYRMGCFNNAQTGSGAFVASVNADPIVICGPKPLIRGRAGRNLITNYGKLHHDTLIARVVALRFFGADSRPGETIWNA